jgi:hypothetical protein
VPQIEEATEELASLPPYNESRSCPKCRARFRLVPGDRFNIERDGMADGDGYLYCTCPRCLSAIEIAIADADRALDCFIQLPYRDYDTLVNRAEQADRINRALEAIGDLSAALEWIEGELDTIGRRIATRAADADRPAPRRRRDEEEEYEEPRGRPSRQRPVYGPRGAIDPEREAAMVEGIITVGGGSGRRGSTLGDDDGER